VPKLDYHLAGAPGTDDNDICCFPRSLVGCQVLLWLNMEVMAVLQEDWFLGGVIQITQYKSKGDALDRIEKYLDECAKLNVKLVCLQPYFLTGFADRDQAESIPGESTERLGRKCRQHGLYLAAGSMVERSGSDYYSTVPLIGPEGNLIARYRSLKLSNYGPKGELAARLRRGEDIITVHTDVGTIGLTEAGISGMLATVLRARGCEVVVSIEGCVAQDNDAFRFGARDAAYSGNFYVLAANPWGKVTTPSGETHVFLGSSRIISPRGEILANVGEYGEGFAVAPIYPTLAKQLQEATNEKRLRSDVFRICLRSLSSYMKKDVGATVSTTKGGTSKE